MSLEILGIEITTLNQILDLNVKFNECLTFSTHLEFIMAKANRCIAMLRHNLRVRRTESQKILFQTYFQPSIIYRCQLWFNIEVTNMDKINELNRKFWRLRGSNIPRLDVLSMVQFMAVQCLMLLFDYKQRKPYFELEDSFNEVSHNFDTHQASQDPIYFSKQNGKQTQRIGIYCVQVVQHA